MRRVAAWLGVALLAGVMLAGCGKKGSPVPPGPQSEVIYPKTYPSR